MPILNSRDARATRFESSASNDTETNILKGPFVNISRIVGISRAYSLHKCILMTNPLPRDLKCTLLWYVGYSLYNVDYSWNSFIVLVKDFTYQSIRSSVD